MQLFPLVETFHVTFFYWYNSFQCFILNFDFFDLLNNPFIFLSSVNFYFQKILVVEALYAELVLDLINLIAKSASFKKTYQSDLFK
jgi:hypothetical protein